MIGSARAAKSLPNRGDVRAIDRWRVLERAIAADDAAAVARAIADGADPSYDVDGLKPLHRAAVRARADVIGALIAAGADVHARDNRGRTALLLTAAGTPAEVWARLLEGRANPNDRLEALRLLLGARADPNTDVLAGQMSDVRDAIGKKRAEALALLLAAGADPNAADEEGSRPLHVAAGIRNDEGVMSKALLNAGADPHARDGEGRTALHRARSEGTVAALLEAGADPDARAHDGGSVVHHIAREVHNVYMIIGALAKAGADLDARDGAGDTALHVAVECMNNEAAQALIDGGADIWARDANGRTPLHQVRNTRAALMLLASGADGTEADSGGCLRKLGRHSMGNSAT